MDRDTQLIGIRIMQKRKANKLTQEQLSEKLGISSGHLSCIERGKYPPSVKFIYQLCDILGGTPNYYLLGEVTPEQEQRIIFLFKQLPTNFQNAVENSIEEFIKAYKDELKIPKRFD